MRALENQRIVVTRAAHQAEDLARPLRELGAEVILLPTIAIAPPLDPFPLRAAAASCDAFDWILFTSANAIEAFAAQLPRSAASYNTRVATVGAATREAAGRRGFQVSITPETYVAESLIEAFGSEDLDSRRILIPSAAVTRDVVATELRKRGADVTVVEAYRNVVPPEVTDQAGQVFREPYPEWITFTSSSAVDNLVRSIGIEPLRKVNIATIGPITSETVRHHQLTVHAKASEHSTAGLISALCAYKHTLKQRSSS